MMNNKEWKSKENLLDYLIEELKDLKKGDISPLDLMIFFRVQSLNLLISIAKQMSEESENKSVFSHALSLFIRLVGGDYGLMNSLLREEGVERDCASCPVKEECDDFNKGESCSGEGEAGVDDFLNKLENDLRKWN
jgi:hypothetical protein